MESPPRSNFSRPESTGDSSTYPESRNPNKKKYIRAVLSYLVAGICLLWVFHDIHFHQLIGGMALICWWLWILCVGLQFLAYFCVAYEWQLLLRPIGRIPLTRAVQAVFAGRFANDVLPMQLGYLVRCALAARCMNVGIMSIFPSLIVERLWDGIWLAIGIGVAAFLLPLPADMIRAAKCFGAIILAGTVATALLVLLLTGRAGHSAPTDSRTKPIQRLWLAIGRLIDGVRDIVRSGLLTPVVGLSLLKLAIQGAAFIGFLWAYHLRLPPVTAAAVFLAGYLGISVPSTPAGTGMFQVSVVVLIVFGIDKSVAAGFALITFVSITVPLAIAGFFALAQTGLRLSTIKRETTG